MFPPLSLSNHTDSSTQIVEAVWPLSSVNCRTEMGSKAVLPLRTFIQETLRRSRTSYSTLQVALYYLILIKPHVPNHDFTMEQPDDVHSSRVLQCGRRMFLAALILASKYLQDRNYSARAWSKISGLNTQEINQNEMAFLIAVNWKLHITDEVFQRWTEIVLKYTPPAPPSPGTTCQLYEQQTLDWKQVILKLNPGLDNIEGLIPVVTTSAALSRDLMTPRENACGFGYDSAELTLTPKAAYKAPSIMEPTPASVYTPGRFAPALGLLPTPRLTPQTSGFSTPAVSAASYLLGKSSAMCLAMSQASHINAAQCLDRLPISTTSSPQTYFPTRRSSLAASVSTASSPESMVSDSSRSSRSSSISSASSLVCAPASGKLGVPARFRALKLCTERSSLRPTIASVPEDYEETCITSSPESYTGPVGKLGELSLDTPLARRERELDEMTRDSANDAARALHEMQQYQHSGDSTPTAKSSLKRSRAASIESSLQDNVRDLLGGNFYGDNENVAWSDSLVRSRLGSSHEVVASYQQQLYARSRARRTKRVCCSTEASEGFEISSLHGAMGGFGGPGMWEGILN
jgi:PHO85 cyclin-5